jgi:serine/threonine protein kinase
MFPGESTMNQLERICEVTGKPGKTDMKAIKSKHTQTMIDGLSVKQQKSLQQMYPTAPPDALDLLTKLLQFNPEKRYTIEQAISHPYLAQFHNASEEPILSAPIQISLDDNKRLKIGDYRRYLYKKIVERKKQLRKKREAAAAAAGVPLTGSSSGAPTGSPSSSTKSRTGSANQQTQHSRQPSSGGGPQGSPGGSVGQRTAAPAQKSVASSSSSSSLPPANNPNRTMQSSASAASVAKKR